MENNKIALPLNGKDLDAEAVLDGLRDSDFYGSIVRDGYTRDYFTVNDAVWCMTHQYNCKDFTLKPVDWANDYYRQTVEERLLKIADDLNECNDDEYVRGVLTIWEDSPSVQMQVCFYYTDKQPQ